MFLDLRLYEGSAMRSTYTTLGIGIIVGTIIGAVNWHIYVTRPIQAQYQVLSDGVDLQLKMRAMGFDAWCRWAYENHELVDERLP